jgi:hypothetical protein
MKPKGVLSLDDTLLSHYGRHFENIAKLYDSSQQCYVWAHNLVNLHYSDDQTDYPVAFELWEPADLEALETGLKAVGVKLSKLALKESEPKKWRQYLLNLWRRKQNIPEVKALYKSKLTLAEEMLKSWVSKHPELSSTIPVKEARAKESLQAVAQRLQAPGDNDKQRHVDAAYGATRTMLDETPGLTVAAG